MILDQTKNAITKCIQSLLGNIASSRVDAIVTGAMAGTMPDNSAVAGVIGLLTSFLFFGIHLESKESAAKNKADSLLRHMLRGEQNASLRQDLLAATAELSIDNTVLLTRLEEISEVIGAIKDSHEKFGQILAKNAELFDALVLHIENNHRVFTGLVADHASLKNEILKIEEYLRLDPPIRLPIAGYGDNDLFYGNELVPFFGRESELEMLQHFLQGEVTPCWWLVTGTGGIGKNRTALEFCRRNKSKWRVGFLSEGESFGQWHTWQPKAPTLIIIDDVAQHAEYAGELLASLAGRTTRYPVRILLLERYEDEVWMRRFYGSEERRSRLETTRYSKETLNLKSFGDDHLWSILTFFLERKSRAVPDRAKSLLALREIDPAGTPLFAAFAGDALADTGNIRLWDWDRNGLLSFAIEKELFRWRGRGIDENDPTLNLAVFATLIGGLDRDGTSPWECPDLAAYLPTDRDCPKYMLLGLESKKRFGPITPDILGEYFVLEYLRDRATLAGLMVRSAWKFDPSRYSPSEFLHRVVKDFGGHATIPNLTKCPDDSQHRFEWGNVVLTAASNASSHNEVANAYALYTQLNELEKEGHLTLPPSLRIRALLLRINALVSITTRATAAGCEMISQDCEAQLLREDPCSSRTWNMLMLNTPPIPGQWDWLRWWTAFLINQKTAKGLFQADSLCRLIYLIYHEANAIGFRLALDWANFLRYWANQRYGTASVLLRAHAHSKYKFAMILQPDLQKARDGIEELETWDYEKIANLYSGYAPFLHNWAIALLEGAFRHRTGDVAPLVQRAVDLLRKSFSFGNMQSALPMAYASELSGDSKSCVDWLAKVLPTKEVTFYAGFIRNQVRDGYYSIRLRPWYALVIPGLDSKKPA